MLMELSEMMTITVNLFILKLMVKIIENKLFTFQLKIDDKVVVIHIICFVKLNLSQDNTHSKKNIHFDGTEI
jgi:hypothetical protein